MRAKEMADFISRKEKSNAAAERRKSFDPEKDLVDVSAAGLERISSFGVIVLRTSVMEGNAQAVYELYKIRWESEQLFDTLRNTLGADESHMRDDTGVEAWTFINHISLIMACRTLSLLRKKKMSKNTSLAGLMDMLSNIHAVRVAVVALEHEADVSAALQKRPNTFGKSSSRMPRPVSVTSIRANIYEQIRRTAFERRLSVRDAVTQGKLPLRGFQRQINAFAESNVIFEN